MMSRSPIFTAPVSRQPVFRDPVFRSLASLASEFDRACASAGVSRSVRASLPAMSIPAISITASDTSLVIEADVPGMALEDLEIMLHGDELTIRGERRFSEPDGSTVLRQERRSGTFERTFTLPAEVDTQNARASLDLGVLTVVLPKTQAARPRRLDITGATPSGSSLQNNSEAASAN